MWITQGAENDKAIALAEENGIKIIYKKCILMFAKPSGIHKFHGFVTKVFGKYPK